MNNLASRGGGSGDPSGQLLLAAFNSLSRKNQALVAKVCVFGLAGVLVYRILQGTSRVQ